MANNHVVRHMNDVINHEVEKCQGGKGSIYVRQILGYDVNLPIPGFQGDSEAFHFIHITTLPKGSSVGEHHHINNEEIYLVIKGVGEMVVDGDTYIMKPGSIGLVRNGAAHSMKNIRDEELQMLVVEVELK